MAGKRCAARYHPDDAVAYAYGEMAAETIAAYRAHLDECPSCREAVAGLRRAAEVCCWVREEGIPEPVSGRAFDPARLGAARFRFGPRWLWAPVAVAAVALLVWVLLPARPAPGPDRPAGAVTAVALQPAALLQAASGQVSRLAGARLAEGDDLRLGGDGSARLRLADGSTLSLIADSHLRIVELGTRGDRFELRAGSVTCQVQPRDGARPFRIQAGTGLLTVKGTRFTVSLDPARRLKVAVEQGVVELARLDAPDVRLELTAGQQAWLDSAGKPMRAQGSAPGPKTGKARNPSVQPTQVAQARPAPVEKPVAALPPPQAPEPAVQPASQTVEALVEQLYQDTQWIFDDLRAELAAGRFQSVLHKIENYLIDPESPARDEALFLKAVCLEKLGRFRQARETYRTYLLRWPAGRRAKDAKLGDLRTRGK